MTPLSQVQPQPLLLQILFLRSVRKYFRCFTHASVYYVRNHMYVIGIPFVRFVFTVEAIRMYCSLACIYVYGSVRPSIDSGSKLPFYYRAPTLGVLRFQLLFVHLRVLSRYM